MPKYKVEIVLTTSRSTVVYVEAEDGDEAVDKAELMYINECPTAPLDWVEGDIEAAQFYEEKVQ
jgi:hypothetical protein